MSPQGDRGGASNGAAVGPKARNYAVTATNEIIAATKHVLMNGDMPQRSMSEYSDICLDIQAYVRI